MRATLQHDQGNAVEYPDGKYACMTLGRASRKIWNSFVGDADRVDQRSGKGPEPRSQHQANTRAQTGALNDELRRLFSAEEVVGSRAQHNFSIILPVPDCHPERSTSSL